ncbi:MAG: hypothetical protein IPM42_08110 [Saprospiraceae bacterium]|nr:hypothetical protein [Saprospiraceae bacterium]
MTTITRMMCGMTARFTPLENDNGDELIISAITGAPAGVVLLNMTTIEVGETVSQSFSFIYTVTDKNGNTANASVMVNIQVPVLTVSGQNHQVLSGQSLTGNILTGSDCPECRITNATGTVDGVFEWNENGSYTVQIDNLSVSPATYNFIFQITGKCGITTSASLSVIVLPKSCDIELITTNTPANCDMDDGSITISNIDDTYRLMWNTGSDQSVLSGIPSGNYTLSITIPELSCIQSFSLMLEEKMAEYIRDLQTSPGNCYQSGQILMHIAGLTPGPFIVTASGSAGNFTFEVPEGVSDIAALISQTSEGKVITGIYEISVRDKSKDARCTQSISVNIPEEEVRFQLADDNYAASQNMPLTGNILDNDTGIGLKVTDIQIPSGVVMEWYADGNFSFIANEGQYELTYTAVDTCGQTATATIIIKVENIVCAYQVTFTTIPALCGSTTGSVTAMVFPSDPVTLLWSNGNTSSNITNLEAGTYTLTVTHPTGACNQIFSVQVETTNVPYLTTSDITHESCNNKAEIILNVFGPVSGFLNFLVFGPSGNHQFSVPSGNILLSNFIPLTSGIWTLSINDAAAGPQCAQQYTFELLPYLPPVLTLLDFQPPSSPTAKDGIVFVQLTGGNPPYNIVGPGMTYANLMPGFNALQGFPSGVFSLFATDASGCMTNIIIVEMFGGKPALKTDVSFTPFLPVLLLDFGDPEHPSSTVPELEIIALQSLQTSILVGDNFLNFSVGQSQKMLSDQVIQNQNYMLNVFIIETGRQWSVKDFYTRAGIRYQHFNVISDSKRNSTGNESHNLNLSLISGVSLLNKLDFQFRLDWYPDQQRLISGNTLRYLF